VVPQHTATIGFPDEIYSPLNGNHIQIVKYMSENEDNYQRVAGNISIVVQKIKRDEQMLKTTEM
jgi:hypothetical protein